MAPRSEWIGSTRYAWVPRAQQYRDQRTGRFVSRATVRQVLDRRLDAESRRVQDLARQLQRGEITGREWQAQMRNAVKDVQLASTALAKGGWAQMTAADYGRAGQRVREQYAYLQRFAQAIEAGLPLDGRFMRRAQMYAQAGRRIFHLTERGEMRAQGFDQERNVRYAGDSCAGCIAAEAAGWVEIGSLVPIGERECLSNCRCRLAFRRSTSVERAAA